MSVAMVGPVAPYRGGIAHYTTLLSHALAKKTPTSVFNFTRLYPERLFPGKTQLDESGAAFDIDNLRVLDSMAPLTWRKTGKAIARTAPAAVVFQWWHPFFLPAYSAAAFWLRRHAPQTRVFFLCHNVHPHEATIVDTALAKLAFAVPDALVVHSQTDADALAKLAPGKDVIVHPHPPYDAFSEHAVGREAARKKLGVDGDVILFFGLIRKYKGLDCALDALALVRRTRPVTLVVAGEFYDDPAPYREKIRALGLDDSVVLHDRYIANEDVAPYFEAADLTVLPYVTATQSGIAQISFSLGTPVLATRVGGLHESITPGKTGDLVPPQNPRALADAIERHFVVVDECKARGRGATPLREDVLQAAQRYSWDSLADAILNRVSTE